MIPIDDEYSINVEHRDGGGCYYQLFNGFDDMVFEQSGGTAWTASEETMKLFGRHLIITYEISLRTA